MTVEVYCMSCTIDDERGDEQPRLMKPIGQLTIATDKTQAQEYECPICLRNIQLLINTIKEN